MYTIFVFNGYLLLRRGCRQEPPHQLKPQLSDQIRIIFLLTFLKDFFREALLCEKNSINQFASFEAFQKIWNEGRRGGAQNLSRDCSVL